MGKRYDDTLSHFGQFPVLFERIHQSAAVMFLAPYVPLYDKMGYDQQDNGNDDGGRKQLE